tara:strand:- start:2385 stop:4292 length:1908 start_codon:yes stop_codon:yes gene_type:complete
MKNNERYLTKSRFSLAVTCPTKLFYTNKKQFTNNRNDDEFLLALAEGGFQVGELAKYYHPGGHNIDTLDSDEAIKQTNELLLNDKVIIYEAAFKFSHYFIRVDVLVKDGSKIELIEVKAKSFKTENKFYNASGFISTNWLPYFYDVAFQLWVMQNARPDFIITPYLMLADKNKKTSIDGLNQFFKIKKENNRKKIIVEQNLDLNKLGDRILKKIDVGDFVEMIYDSRHKKKIESQSFIDKIKEYGQYYNEDKIYPVTLGLQCKKCEFKDDLDLEKNGYFQCWNSVFPNFDISDAHVFDIWNYRQSHKVIDSNVYKMKDVYSSEFVETLNDRQYLQVDKTVNGSIEEHIKPELFNEMQKWEFPLHFIDFETCMIAVPFHKNRTPYEQIAFQFSCHTLYENGKIEHYEWIESDANNFPNYEFVRQLKKILDNDNGSIFRYSAHENTVLLQIKSQMLEEDEGKYKDLIDWIDTITYRKDNDNPKHKIVGDRNMIDLLEYVKKYYYHPMMKGSNSLKYVLPAIFSTSSFIKDKYSKPLNFGTHLKDSVLWKIDESSNRAYNPYRLLENKYQTTSLDKEKLYFLDEKIEDGAAAMLAYSKLQFADMLDEERKLLTLSLLQYCELDTIAMVIIYEHWNSLK